MPRSREILFPAAGVVRGLGFRSQGNQGPFPTPWSLNVRLEESLTGRLRGGSFTGISAAARPSEIRYRDRKLTFSGAGVTASRVGDDTDTSLSSDLSDVLRPYWFQFSHGGAKGRTIVALVPHKDKFLLVFTASETWVQEGDPLPIIGGPRRRISDQVGIIGADAWCVNHDTIYFLSPDGLYSVNADGGGFRSLSDEKLPEELSGVVDSTCTLTYQHSDEGVYIHTTGQDWFYDIARDAFWPFDATETDSHVLIGPLQLGTPDRFGEIQTLHGIIAAGSATVNWRIVPGETAEEAAANGKAAIEAHLAGNSYSAYVRGSGSWSAGRSQTAMPRTTAMWACVWLSSAGTWAYEGMTIYVIPAGRWR